MSDLDDLRPTRIDPVESQQRSSGREARWPVDVMVGVQILFEFLGPLAVAPGVHVAHQDRWAGIHLGMVEQGSNLALSGPID